MKKVIKVIAQRRSIRRFSSRTIETQKIMTILEAGRWAPSGLNNQPWRFIVVTNAVMKNSIAAFTEYSNTVKNAACVILVFLDKKQVYNRTKDVQAIGACIQNMLLQATASGIATCWLGEILNQKNRVNVLVKLKSRYELMAGIACGYPQQAGRSRRIPLKKLLLKTLR